jgi:hypothetical protein
MYQFEESDASLLHAALDRAMSADQSYPRTISARHDSARQFLTREILKLYRAGERDLSALAASAAGTLRNHVQAQESRFASRSPYQWVRPMMRDGRKLWTIEEDGALILAVREKIGLTPLSVRLRRTIPAVRSRVRTLRLSEIRPTRLPHKGRHLGLGGEQMRRLATTAAAPWA